MIAIDYKSLEKFAFSGEILPQYKHDHWSYKVTKTMDNAKINDHLASIFFQFCRNIGQIKQICQLNRNLEKNSLSKSLKKILVPIYWHYF